MFIRNFKNKASAEIALNINSKAVRSLLPVNLFISAIKRLKILEAVVSVEDLSNYNGLRFEKLSGDRKGQFSIRINNKYRICFKEIKGELCDVEIVDYH